MQLCIDRLQDSAIVHESLEADNCLIVLRHTLNSERNMDRRKFVRLAGGGVVAAATVGVAACASTAGSDFPAEAVRAWQGPVGETDSRRIALSYAITAPNPHNLQPWLVDLQTPNEIWLYTDPQRLLPQTDPLGRQILIGHGAFLELLSMALAEQGLSAQVQLWPKGTFGERLVGDLPIARLVLKAGASKDPLFARILQRRTPKTDFDTSRAVAADTLQSVIASHANPAILTQGTVAADRLGRLRALCVASARVELTTPRTMMESINLIRVGPQEILAHRDGISINSLPVRMLNAFGLFDRSVPPAEGTSEFKLALSRFEGHSQSAMGFLWMSTAGNSRSEQIDAGRAYVRLQLKATELGLGVHPMSQALQEFAEMKPFYEQAHQLLLGRPAPTSAIEPTVQMFCRLGYLSAPASSTPRRPITAFVRT
jgi:hypothetical protein